MFYRTIFVYLVGFLLVKLVEMSKGPEITFTINVARNNYLTCDHSDDKKHENKYTVLEGEQFTIVTKYKDVINHVICHAYNNENFKFKHKNNYQNMKNVSTFTVEKKMGTLWKCQILTHKFNPLMKPVVQFNNENYTAAYCFMKIHVRQKDGVKVDYQHEDKAVFVLGEPPQTILVNNMVVTAVRETRTEKDFDFIAEYQYEDGDTVNVTCANFVITAKLSMEYEMAGTSSDKSTVNDISSSKMIGFITKLYSGHNNSYLICTNTETTDYTKVKLRFIMRTKPNIVSITINGMILRPILTVVKNNHYEIKYKFAINQIITVTCEVEQTDMQLVVVDDDLDNSTSTKTVLIANKKTEIKFYLKKEDDNKSLACAADNVTVGQAESVYIQFTTANFPIDDYPSVHMKLPSSGAVMELYSYTHYKLTVLIYEFKHDETLQLTCGPLVSREKPGPVIYLQLNSNVRCQTVGWNVSTTLEHVTREHVYPPIVCYLKEVGGPEQPPAPDDTVFKEIRVILRDSIATTSTSTTTTTANTPTTEKMQVDIAQAATVPDHNASSLETNDKAERNDESDGSSKLPLIAGIVACIIICVIVIIIIIRFRKRKHSQGGPHTPNYENLAEPNEATIPAYPPQWENNYAVPVDRRTDDTTYSEPCPPELYATPVPKHLRNNKQKPLDPTYAVLAVQKGRAKKNVFKESEDPNYSELYANSQECYGKVLPKSMRNQTEQDNPYSYVTNEPKYANTDEPEPMYCEPGKAQGAEYANLNNSHYVNSNAPEYVEPTYCEPQKRMK